MNNMEITIASPEDAASIKQINQEIWIATYPNEELGISLEAIKERVSKNLTLESVREFAQSLAGDTQRTWIAKEDSNLLGYCTAGRFDDHNQLMAIYVLPSYHGKNVGNQLIEKAFEWLGGGKDIHVEVASYNERAIRFYERHQFKSTGKTGDSRGIPTIELVRFKSS